MSSLYYNELAIGFVAWSIYNRIATIITFVIHPNFRKQGNAKILFNSLSQIFVKKDIYMLLGYYIQLPSSFKSSNR